MKQVTPPFKPAVESDESTANFDPEFTEADLKEQGIDFDDEEDDEGVADAFSQLTVGNTITNTGAESGQKTPPSSAQAPKAAAAPSKPGVEINKKDGAAGSSPITSSVQENFRGFTYMGESVIGQAAGLLGRDRKADKEDPWNEGDEEVDLDGLHMPADDENDDDWEDADDGPQMKSRYKGNGHEAGGVLID